MRHLSLSTEETYTLTIRRFIRFHQGRHSRDMGAEEVRAYLSHMASSGPPAAKPLVAALLGPDAYPHRAGDLRVHETPISWVVLAGPYTTK